MTWREKAFDRLWVNAPELKSRARQRGKELHAYVQLHAAHDTDYVAMAIGYRAGRLMALRLEAYDRKETR